MTMKVQGITGALAILNVVNALVILPRQFSGEKILEAVGYRIVNMQYNITLHDGTSIAQQGTIEGFIKQYPDTDADLGTPGNPDSGIDTTRQTTLFLPRLGTSHIGETTRYTTSAGTSGGGSGYIGSPDFPLELLDCSYGEFVRRDIIATGIRYLRRGAAGRLRIDADKRECSRVSCSNDGAIYACPDDGAAGTIYKQWGEVADISEAIMLYLCPSSNKIIQSDTRGRAAGHDHVSIYVMRSIGHC